MNSKVSFVIPVYNEQGNIELLVSELVSLVAERGLDYEIIFIDDGSTDQSLEKVKQIATQNKHVFFIELSRNFGHQYALKAGLDFAAGDCVISMDADLQHPPAIVHSLIDRWNEGFDIVYTRRIDTNIPFIKRKTSAIFYKIMNAISDMNFETGTADFRLMNRKSLDAMKRLNESELFLRGLVKWSGFRQTAVDYVPRARFSGKSKYNLKKMFSFALRGITSFSVKPLRLIAYLGMTLFLISMILVPYALISYLMGQTVSGWTSLIITVIFFGSLQLLMMGIIGLYLSKLVIQSKNRPLYFIRDSNYPLDVSKSAEHIWS